MSEDVKQGPPGSGRGAADDTETASRRRERGEDREDADPRERMANVPIAPHSAGVLGAGIANAGGDGDASSGAEADRKAAEGRGSH